MLCCKRQWINKMKSHELIGLRHVPGTVCTHEAPAALSLKMPFFLKYYTFWAIYMEYKCSIVTVNLMHQMWLLLCQCLAIVTYFPQMFCRCVSCSYSGALSLSLSLSLLNSTYLSSVGLYVCASVVIPMLHIVVYSCVATLL